MAVKDIIGGIIDEYLNGGGERLTVPSFGTYIKSSDGEVRFSSLLRSDDGVLITLITNKLHSTDEQAQALIRSFIVSEKTVKQSTPPQIPQPVVEPVVQQEVNNLTPTPLAPQQTPPTTVKHESIVGEQKTTVDKESKFDKKSTKSRQVRKKRIDPLKVVAIITIISVIALIVSAYIINGGAGLGI